MMGPKARGMIEGAVIALVAVVLGVIGASVHAQRAENTTRQWQLATVGPPVPGNGEIYIFDTEGVCLYFSRMTGQAGAYGQTVPATALAAVPKTQLPKGAGCQ